MTSRRSISCAFSTHGDARSANETKHHENVRGRARMTHHAARYACKRASTKAAASVRGCGARIVSIGIFRRREIIFAPRAPRAKRRRQLATRNAPSSTRAVVDAGRRRRGPSSTRAVVHAGRRRRGVVHAPRPTHSSRRDDNGPRRQPIASGRVHPRCRCRIALSSPTDYNSPRGEFALQRVDMPGW